MFSALQPGQVQAIVDSREPCRPWTDPQSVPPDVSALPQDADVLHEFHTSSGAVASSSSVAPESTPSTSARPSSPRPGNFGGPPAPPPGPPPAVTLTSSPATTAERAPAGKHIFQEDGSACAGAGAAAQVQAEIGQGRNPGAGGSRPASVAGGPDPGAGGSDPAPGAGPGPPPPARLVACSLGKWHRQSPLGHIRVDSAEVARAPGGGPATSGLNPALCAQASAAPAYRKILDAYTDCILQLAKQGIPEISVAVG